MSGPPRRWVKSAEVWQARCHDRGGTRAGNLIEDQGRATPAPKGLEGERVAAHFGKGRRNVRTRRPVARNLAARADRGRQHQGKPPAHTKRKYAVKWGRHATSTPGLLAARYSNDGSRTMGDARAQAGRGRSRKPRGAPDGAIPPRSPAWRGADAGEPPYAAAIGGPSGTGRMAERRGLPG